jgi:hypothetical protein
MQAKKSTKRLKSVEYRQKQEEHARRPYYGVQEPDYAEGGGFGRHRDMKAGESQEGSRNPSGHTVKPNITPPSERTASG